MIRPARAWKWSVAAAVVLVSSAAVVPHAGARVASGGTKAPLPPSALAVRRGDAWRTWWDASRAPARWSAANPDLSASVDWHRGAAGLEWAELVLAGSGEAWRTRVILARIDPARVALRLDTAYTEARRAGWTIERAPARALFAVNAGQFLYTLPWGRVVLDGTPYLLPSSGPLSSTVVVDSSGAIRIEHGDGARATGAAWAFQSYPTLLRAGDVPREIQSPDAGVDLSHRDARAAIGRMHDGRVLVALTRFDAAGPTLGFVPFGLTTPEMAAVMGALGAEDAVMLDGGISGQMTLRDSTGRAHEWVGVRAVPLALVGLPR